MADCGTGVTSSKRTICFSCLRFLSDPTEKPYNTSEGTVYRRAERIRKKSGLFSLEGVKFSVSMGKIFFDKNQICIIVLSKFLVFCCRIIYLIIVLPIRLRLYMNFKIFCSTNNGISNPFSWALPTPGLRNKVGFSGNTINAEGIR